MRVLKSYLEQLLIIALVSLGIYGMSLLNQLDEKTVMEKTIHPSREDNRGQPRLPFVVDERVRASVSPGHRLYAVYREMEMNGEY